MECPGDSGVLPTRPSRTLVSRGARITYRGTLIALVAHALAWSFHVGRRRPAALQASHSAEGGIMSRTVVCRASFTYIKGPEVSPSGVICQPSLLVLAADGVGRSQRESSSLMLQSDIGPVSHRGSLGRAWRVCEILPFTSEPLDHSNRALEDDQDGMVVIEFRKCTRTPILGPQRECASQTYVMSRFDRPCLCSQL